MEGSEVRTRAGGATHGLLALPRGGAFLLRHPRLWPYAALPLLINCVLFVWLFVEATFRWLPALVAWLTPQSLPAWLAWAGWILLPALKGAAFLLAFAAVVVLVALSFTGVGCVIAAPFNDALSDRVEELVRGTRAEQPFSFGLLARDLGRTLWQAAGKLVVVLGVFVATLPLLIVPVLGQAAYTVINLAVGTWYLGLEYVDLPMARHRWALAARRRWAWGRRSSLVGFGLGVYLTTLVPLLGLLVMPCAVVGGTRLWIELSDPDGPRPPDN